MWVICLGRGEESGEYTRCDFMYTSRRRTLNIWKLITPQSDVNEKDAKSCVDSPLGL